MPLAGSSLAGLQDGPASSAQFSFACGLAYDAGSDTLFVADSGNHAVRAVRDTRESVQLYDARHHHGSPTRKPPADAAAGGGGIPTSAAAATVCVELEAAIADAEDLLRGAGSRLNVVDGAAHGGLPLSSVVAASVKVIVRALPPTVWFVTPQAHRHVG